jgi:hypothetical protein
MDLWWMAAVPLSGKYGDFSAADSVMGYREERRRTIEQIAKRRCIREQFPCYEEEGTKRPGIFGVIRYKNKGWHASMPALPATATAGRI